MPPHQTSTAASLLHNGRRVRQRQDLAYTTPVDRLVNDRSAQELYEQLLLGAIRNNVDVNLPEEVVEYPGYVPAHYDAKRGQIVAQESRARLDATYRERMEMLSVLRASNEHKALAPFQRMLKETEYWMGEREWMGSEIGGGGGSKKAKKGGAQPKNVVHRNALSSIEEDEHQSQSELVDVAFHITETPSYIRGKLRDYQIEGVNWLLGLHVKGINGILADEMGLGKTFQTIATLSILKFTYGLPGPHIVVCPKSVLGNWYREIRQWCPSLSVFKFHAPGSIRPQLMKAHFYPLNNIKYDVVVTTFEMVLEELSTLKKIGWQYLIVDEAHKLKNEESRAHMALASLHTNYRIIITGTPLQNNLKELWALLHFLAPALFSGDGSQFEEWFNSSKGVEDTEAITKMHVILNPLMLRRLKSDVNTGIPPKKEIYVSCQLTRKQREWYSTVLAKDAELLNKATGGAASRLNNIMMQLRKVVNHPYLMPGGEDGPPFKTDEWLIRHSGKMIVLDMLLRKLKQDAESNHKVLIFSQFTTMLDILEDYCGMVGYKYCRIDGNTSAIDRDMQMAQFNAMHSEYFVFLLSTRAGGLGINLQAANHVILYDSDWNPQMDLQAQDRAHRIGQKRHVRVYRFICDGTMEEKVYKRALKKLYLDAMVVQQGRIQGKAKTQASSDEMLALIRFGAEEIFKSRGADVTEADIEQLLSEGEARQGALAAEMIKTCQVSLASFKLGADDENVYDFEGVSYNKSETKTLHILLARPPPDNASSTESKVVAVVPTAVNEEETTPAAAAAAAAALIAEVVIPPHAMSQEELFERCSKFGEVTKCVLHPNLREALVSFRSAFGAAEAKKQLEATYPWECNFASKESMAVVSRDMIDQCFNTGAEKLGRGQRNREPVRFYTDEDVAKLQQKRDKAPPLKIPKPTVYPYWQLYNNKRLLEIHNTEVALLVRNWRVRHDRDEPVAAPPSGSPVSGDAPSTGNEQQAPPIEDVLTLTAQEQEEKERLIAEGFSTWGFDEFRLLRSIITRGHIGLRDYAAIAQAMHGSKTEGEVRDYLSALLERGHRCIANFSKIEQAMVKAQKKSAEEEALVKAVMTKVETVTEEAYNILRATSTATGEDMEGDATDGATITPAQCNQYLLDTLALPGGTKSKDIHMDRRLFLTMYRCLTQRQHHQLTSSSSTSAIGGVVVVGGAAAAGEPQSLAQCIQEASNHVRRQPEYQFDIFYQSRHEAYFLSRLNTMIAAIRREQRLKEELLTAGSTMLKLRTRRTNKEAAAEEEEGTGHQGQEEREGHPPPARPNADDGGEDSPDVKRLRTENN